MDVGMMMVFASYGWENCSDARVWDEEIRLARLAADLGFDCLWSAEHHFNDYSFVPDNLQLMTYLTALLPVAQGVSAYAALRRAVDTCADGRSRGQVMADALVERVTGRSAAVATPIAVNLVVSDETLLIRSTAPAQIHGYGPDWRLQRSQGSMSAVIEPAA